MTTLIYGAVSTLVALCLAYMLLHIPTIKWAACSIKVRNLEYMQIGDTTNQLHYVYLEGCNFKIKHESTALFTALEQYSYINAVVKYEARLVGFHVQRNVLVVAPTSYVEKDKEYATV